MNHKKKGMDKFKVNLKQNEGTMEILFNSSVLIQNESLKQYLLKQQYHIFGLFEKYFWNENFLVITPIQLILSSTQVFKPTIIMISVINFFFLYNNSIILKGIPF